MKKVNPDRKRVEGTNKDFDTLNTSKEKNITVLHKLVFNIKEYLIKVYYLRF